MKSLAKKLVRRLGFDIRRYSPSTSEAAQLLRMLSAHRVNLVFDVGANAGQYGHHLREAGYNGQIVSFEPVLAAWEELRKQSRNDSSWTVAPRVAVGDDDGEVEINVSANSFSSSILGMLDAHSNAAPDSQFVRKEVTPLCRLDTVASRYLKADSVVFLKVDTQGYEDRVLRGAQNLLGSIVGLQLELSLVPLYEGQRLFEDLFKQLRDLDFSLWAMSPVFADPQSGRLLQLDATFFRS